MESANQQTSTMLKELCRQWDSAIAENDGPAIGKFMSSDWVIIGTEGGITSKPDFLKFIKSGELVHRAMNFEDIRIEVYEKTGIVTSKGTSSGTYKGVPFSYYEWSTSVFLKSNDGWLCVLTMLTPAAK
jgi:ketosteroid isomerase-like protein